MFILMFIPNNILYQNGQMCLKDEIKEKQSLLLPT